MFKICSGQTEFKQWELNQKVTGDFLEANEQVVFQSASGETIVTYSYSDNGSVVVDVPNKILQTARPFLVNYGQGAKEQNQYDTRFNVVAQAKPDGYVFVDNVRKPEVSGGNSGGSGGVSSWNDLTDKPFGESFDTVLFAEQTVNFEPAEDLGGMNSAVLQGAFADFRVFEVKYNGTSYSCGVTDAGGMLAFGNMSAAGMGQDTGEPFLGLVQEGMCILVSFVDASAAVEIKGGTITPISPNYLPHFKLDLTTFFPEGLTTGVCSTATISEDEEEGNRLFAELQSAAKYGGVRLVCSTNSNNAGRDVFNAGSNSDYHPGEVTYDVVPNCVYNNDDYTVLLSAIVLSSIVYVEINSVGEIRATVREINFRA